MPTTPHGKAVASRNATTHGLFSRDIVLPSLGEDPEGYRQMEHEWKTQIQPRNLLEQHYVEKIAAASWRLRRLHRWQAQLFEDETLTEDERLDRLDKALRHETALHRQIDTAVKMLNKDVPNLYERRVREQVREDLMVSERECRDCASDAAEVELETLGRLRRLRTATAQAADALTTAPLDPSPADPAEPAPGEVFPSPVPPELGARGRSEKCEKELPDGPAWQAFPALAAAPAGLSPRGPAFQHRGRVGRSALLR